MGACLACAAVLHRFSSAALVRKRQTESTACCCVTFTLGTFQLMLSDDKGAAHQSICSIKLRQKYIRCSAPKYIGTGFIYPRWAKLFKIMLRQIRAFRKTSHFLYRQWDRSIDDALLTELLNHLPKPYLAQQKYNLVFSRSFCLALRKKGFFVPKLGKNECLILSIKNFTLITIYKYSSTDDLLRLLKAHRNEWFEIV